MIMNYIVVRQSVLFHDVVHIHQWP